MASLNCLPPTAEPRATQYVPQMVDTITRIIDAGHGYVAGGDVLFAVETVEGYGRLSGRSLVRRRRCETRARACMPCAAGARFNAVSSARACGVWRGLRAL